MKIYSIGYDLMKPGQNYSGLIARLEQLGAKRPLESSWILQTTASAEQVRNDLQRFTDGNDRILIVGLTGEGAWINARIPNAQLQQALTA